MAITAGMVKELREMTGAGMMDCKKALTEADGSMEKAVELLREKGLAASAKKAGRIASEGMVAVYLSDDNKIGAIVEVNSETDFVAKNLNGTGILPSSILSFCTRYSETMLQQLQNRLPKQQQQIWTLSLKKNGHLTLSSQ